MNMIAILMIVLGVYLLNQKTIHNVVKKGVEVAAV